MNYHTFHMNMYLIDVRRVRGAFLVAQLQCRRHRFDSWIGKIPWRRERLPTPVLWPREFQRLYSPWGRKDLDTAEQLSLSFFMNHTMRK